MNEAQPCENNEERIETGMEPEIAAPVRKRGTVVAAQVVFAPPPSVPQIRLGRDEQELGIELLFTIAADGSARPEILQSSGYSAVDAAMLDAAVRWRFQPATIDGRPVESFLRTRLMFPAEGE